MFGRTWLYPSRISLIDACPSRSEAIFGFTPPREARRRARMSQGVRLSARPARASCDRTAGTRRPRGHGTTSLFAALNLATGTTIRAGFRRHRHQEFLHFLRKIDAAVPDDGTAVHLILDNYGTHKTPAVRRWFAKRPRYHLHFTPTYASWLNLVERLFAEVTEKAVWRGSHDSVRALEAAVLAYLAAREEAPRPFVWTADADLILDRVENLSQRISRTGR